MIDEASELVCQRRREVRRVAGGHTILREGEVPDTTFILYSGWAFSYKQLHDGRRQILSFLIPGDTLVLEVACFPHFPLPFSVKALTETTSCAFPVDDMVALMQFSEAQKQELASALRRYLDSVHERLLDLGRRSARGRLAQLLLDLYARLHERGLVTEGRFAFPPSQEHLADALGLTTVYVNRTLVQLRKEGLLSFDREQMTIHDEAELRRIVQEE